MMKASGTWGRLYAVIEAELRSLARQKTPFVLRTAYAALAALIILQMGTTRIPGGSGQALPMLAYQAFATVARSQIGLALLAGALLGVASAYSERHNRTLGLLVLSQLSPLEVMLGKLLALLGLVATVLIGGLPVFAIIGWAGGLDYDWLAALGVLTVVLAAQGIATGLACGFHWRSGTGAAFAAIGLLAVPFIFVRITDMGCCLLLSFQLFGSGALAMEYVALQGQLPRQTSGVVELGIVMSLVWTAVMIYLGSRELPKAAAKGAGRGLRGAFEKLDAYFEEINIGNIRFGSGQPRPPRGNPVAWLGNISAGLALPQYGFRLLTAALLLGCWSLVLVLDGGRWAGPVTLFWAGVATVLALAAGAATFGEEKARGNLPLLLVTPMSARSILVGKLYITLRLLLMVGLPLAALLAYWRMLDHSFSWQQQPFLVFFLSGPVCGYLLARHLSLVLSSSLRAGFGAALVLAGLLTLFNLGRQAFWHTDLGVAVAAVAVVAALVVGLWARVRRRYGTALVALLAAVGTALAAFSGVVGWGLTEWHPLVPLAVALFIDVYTRSTFDSALGRSS